MTAVAMFLFFVELTLNSIAKPDYFNSFYFWLDFVSTVSLITDIGWIWDEIIGNTDYAASNAEQASQLARAGRGARLGTRAGRITRVIRLVRLIRVVKLYKNASTWNRGADNNEFDILKSKTIYQKRITELEQKENFRNEHKEFKTNESNSSDSLSEDDHQTKRTRIESESTIQYHARRYSQQTAATGRKARFS